MGWVGADKTRFRSQSPNNQAKGGTEELKGWPQASRPVAAIPATRLCIISKLWERHA